MGRVRIIRSEEIADVRSGRHRRNDHQTSIQGAKSVSYRAGSQKAKLVEAYRSVWPRSLTDEEAAMMAGLDQTCYWKRCGELREDQVIINTNKTRKGSAGVDRILCRFNEESQ